MGGLLPSVEFLTRLLCVELQNPQRCCQPGEENPDYFRVGKCTCSYECFLRTYVVLSHEVVLAVSMERVWAAEYVTRGRCAATIYSRVMMRACCVGVVCVGGVYVSHWLATLEPTQPMFSYIEYINPVC